MTIETQKRSEYEVAREILAGADVASLPTDYPLDRMAQDRMDDIERLRAEIERLRKALRAVVDAYESDQMVPAIRLAYAALGDEG